MSWKVYVLKSLVAEKLYIGMTENLERRLSEHNAGKSKFTSGYLLWEIVYFEEVEEANAARQREKYLKSAAGRRFVKKQLS